MADVYGRLTGRAGVCLSTLGPGATHIDLPKNIAKMPATVSPLRKQQKRVEFASKDAILEAAFSQTVPSIVVVKVDYSENMKLSKHLKALSSK